MRVNLKQWLHQTRVKLLVRRHQTSLEKVSWQHSDSYQQYLDTQLKRTLLKKNVPLPERARSLIDQAASLIDLSSCNVLCIGCRNTEEIEYFRFKGAHMVTGIDLYSEDDAILVMDMHQMTFPNDSFDLIYSSHSLEHAHDLHKVIGEIVRVGRDGATAVIEMPVNYETRGADLVDIGSLESLHHVFGPNLGRVIWSQEVKQETNASGTDSIRTIIRLVKDRHG